MLIFLLLCVPFIAAAAFFANKRLIRDVYIIVRGRRYTGTCTHKFGFRDGEHLVVWTNSENADLIAHFTVTTFGKPPFELPVYCVGDDPKKANLGLRSIICYLPVVLLTDLTFFGLVFGAIPEWWEIVF